MIDREGRGSALRLWVGIAVITLLEYVWRVAELHFRRPLPRRRHYIAMRLFRTFGHSFPVTLTYPNPLVPGGARLSICLDLCQNHEIYVRAKGRYEIEWLRLIAGAMQDADGFIDVGANVGIYALTIAQAFPEKRVVAVEPVPDNYARLARGVELNRLSHVTTLRAAISDAGGPATFHVSPIHDGGGSLVPLVSYQTGDISVDAAQYRKRHPSFQPTFEVDVISLDSLVETKSVIKIDVEGGEGMVLRSAERVLRKGLVDLMVVEVQVETFGDVVRLLDQSDFECFLYGRRLPVKPEDGRLLPFRVANLLCLRRGSPSYGRVDFA